MSTTTSVSPNHPLSKQERSAIFSRYNRLRHEADAGRANRALGLVQRGEQRPYRTTPDFCSCPDWIERMQYVEGGKCKHQLQLELAQAAQTAKETHQPDEEQEREPSPEVQTDEEPASDDDRMTVDEINTLLYG